MTTARLKTATREVWQYDGYGISVLMPSWVFACTERRNGSLYLVRRSGKQIIHPGEYLIRDLDGDPEWMTEADFLREYELT
jgi:hypothetical protein